MSYLGRKGGHLTHFLEAKIAAMEISTITEVPWDQQLKVDFVFER